MNVTFRNKQINVSGPVFEGLKVLSEINGHSCPDELADILLGQYLEKAAELKWAKYEWAKMRDNFREKYRQRVGQITQNSDPLP